jgi:hypothetical protein
MSKQLSKSALFIHTDRVYSLKMYVCSRSMTYGNVFRHPNLNEDMVFKLIDSVVKSINQKMHVGKFFCYLVKAFDCVNHDILFSELHVYSIQVIAAELFQILSNRQETRGRNKTTQ